MEMTQPLHTRKKGLRRLKLGSKVSSWWMEAFLKMSILGNNSIGFGETYSNRNSEEIPVCIQNPVSACSPPTPTLSPDKQPKPNPAPRPFPHLRQPLPPVPMVLPSH